MHHYRQRQVASAERLKKRTRGFPTADKSGSALAAVGPAAPRAVSISQGATLPLCAAAVSLRREHCAPCRSIGTLERAQGGPPREGLRGLASFSRKKSR